MNVNSNSMMKNILTAALVLISLLSFSQDTITKFYNGNWEEVSELSMAEYYRKAFKGPDGLWIANDYYISGKIQMNGTYKSLKSEVKQGVFNYYHENGEKKTECLFINDAYEGDMKRWDENGMLISLTTFKNGNALQEENFYANGQLKSKGTYKNNKLTGLWQYWDYKGKLILEGTYKNGERTGIWKRYLPDTFVTYSYINGQLNQNLGILVRKRDF